MQKVWFEQLNMMNSLRYHRYEKQTWSSDTEMFKIHGGVSVSMSIYSGVSIVTKYLDVSLVFEA